MSRDELIWASGLFEGEGCITHNGDRQSPLRPKLILITTDADVFVRFYDAIGSIGSLSVRRARLDHHKKAYEWRVTGFEKVQAVIAMLWFGLGERRRSRWREIVTEKMHLPLAA